MKTVDEKEQTISELQSSMTKLIVQAETERGREVGVTSVVAAWWVWMIVVPGRCIVPTIKHREL